MSFIDPLQQFPAFSKKCADSGQRLQRGQVTTLQINVGKLCNQACSHCHVEAGPGKIRENMNGETVQKIIDLADRSAHLTTVDITGGAPEMNPHFRTLVNHFSQKGLTVIDRCNLTVLFEPGQEETAEFLKHHKVSIVASLPCYSEKNVTEQRGDGVFAKSIKALQLLNDLGYGHDPELQLNLVYNPNGAFLPPEQAKLAADYKKKLKDDFSIAFNQLFCMANVPLKRFYRYLESQGKVEQYMNLLIDNFNGASINGLMCRSHVSVSWDGRIFDCDFNQMLELPAGFTAITLDDIDSFDQIEQKLIATANHCYACTAGAGSSCGGSIA